MSFSSAFFAVDPGEGLQASETLGTLETNATSAMASPERQPSAESIDMIKQEDEDRDIVSSDDMPRVKEEMSTRESSPAPASTSNLPMTTTEASPDGAKSTTKSLARRKKGTATAIKPSKRARPSGVKKSGTKAPGTKKKTKTTSSPGPNPAASEDGTGGDNGMAGDGSSESDSGPYCLCRGPDNHRFMIACDRCEDWFHGECIGMDKWTGENLVQKYICPNCSDGKRYVTRYKKMCSFQGCNRPARVYDPDDRSVFCSEEHCHEWWEQLIATLPKSKEVGFDTLTQEEFMGLLGSPPRHKSDGRERTWRLGKTPFAHENAPADCFTDEEKAILDKSAADRHALGETIILCKKMLQLLEMAVKRREAAIAAGKGTKDFCGYDARLDAVGVTAQFSAFLKSPIGEAAFAGPQLGPHPGPIEFNENGHFETSDPLTSGMCIKKKCKPHTGWSAILAKDVKHSMKEFANQAARKLEYEKRVRSAVANRVQRKGLENNTVEVCYNSDEE